MGSYENELNAEREREHRVTLFQCISKDEAKSKQNLSKETPFFAADNQNTQFQPKIRNYLSVQSEIDRNVENDYQLKNNQARRVNTFKLVSYGLIVVFGTKVVQAALSNQLEHILEVSFITFFLFIQLIFVSIKQQYVRLAIIAINHLINIYLFANEEKFDAQMAMLQGVNQMGATYLLVLIGEYLDGVVSIVNLSAFRIAWAITHSSEVQISAIISTLLLLFYINYFNYQFHLGRRSQFLLTCVDDHWEEMMKKISVHQPYLIIQFQEDNLKFLVKSHNKCDKIFNADTQINFLDESLVKGQPLRNYLFDQIIKNNKKDEVTLNYNKQSYLIEACFYQVKKINVLIIFKNIDNQNLMFEQNYKFKYNQVTHMLMKVLKKYQNLTNKKQQCLTIRRRILIMFLTENIKMNQQYCKLIFLQFLDRALFYCKNIKIKLYVAVPITQLISTHPQLFVLILLIILDNSLQKSASIHCKQNCDQEITLIIKGQFNIKQISNFIEPNRKKFDILFKSMILTEGEITLMHTSQIFVPFLHVE